MEKKILKFHSLSKIYSTFFIQSVDLHPIEKTLGQVKCVDEAMIF